LSLLPATIQTLQKEKPGAKESGLFFLY